MFINILIINRYAKKSFIKIKKNRIKDNEYFP